MTYHHCDLSSVLRCTNQEVYQVQSCIHDAWTVMGINLTTSPFVPRRKRGPSDLRRVGYEPNLLKQWIVLSLSSCSWRIGGHQGLWIDPLELRWLWDLEGQLLLRTEWSQQLQLWIPFGRRTTRMRLSWGRFVLKVYHNSMKVVEW